ncbi:sensor histidine kinase [Sphingobacterium sp. HMA12]|uniref:sensor histidine kinase n=1 Tax=Sphingobacterium sp. HMA12 TaxID=2050894 RepID=UPI000CEA4E51|nr:histidine kinase [Sphingobacterium sp. HMA12]
MSLAVRIKWKEFLVIFLIYGIWSVAVFLFLVQLQGFDKTVDQFEGGINLYVSFTHTIIKGTVVFYVLIYHFAIPAIMDRRWGKISIQVIAFFTLLTLYEYYWTFFVHRTNPESVGNLTPASFFITTTILNIASTIISYFTAVAICSNVIRRSKEQLEREKLKAELAAIKYQINPHFLFNSLSLIYTKTYKTNPEASQAVHLLSEIMSYALEDWGEQGIVPLALEAKQIKKVIQMNQIRFNNNIKIRYSEDIQLKDAKIPTLTLVTLVENAFKHGELHDAENQVAIEILARNSKINFRVSNKKRNGPKELSKGIGVNNVQQRLNLMYGSKHTFTIKEDGNYYMTEIVINI